MARVVSRKRWVTITRHEDHWERKERTLPYIQQAQIFLLITTDIFSQITTAENKSLRAWGTMDPYMYIQLAHIFLQITTDIFLQITTPENNSLHSLYAVYNPQQHQRF